MSITPPPSSSCSNEPPSFNSDTELFEYMNNLSRGKYKEACSAVTAWWVAVSESLLCADRHFGWNTLDPESCSGKIMPPALTQWCQENGLNTSAKITKVRAINRVHLLTDTSIEFLINSVGTSKLKVIGQRAYDEINAVALLRAAESLTVKQLGKIPKAKNSLAERSTTSIQSAIRKTSITQIALTEVTKDMHSLTHKMSEALTTGENDVVPPLYEALRSILTKYETEFLTINYE